MKKPLHPIAKDIIRMLEHVREDELTEHLKLTDGDGCFTVSLNLKKYAKLHGNK